LQLARKNPKNNTARTTSPPAQQIKPWYKKAWPWITGTAIVIGWILMNGVTAISNAERLPSAVARIHTKASNWYHTDHNWTGLWTNEGEIDARSQQEIYVDLDLLVQTNGVQGTIASIPQRNAISFEYVLVEGTVTDDTLNLLAYDYFQGVRKELARFKVSHIQSKELDQIKIVTTWQSQPWYPKEAVLWRVGETKLLPEPE
jgi:hypothetical protein